MHGLFSADLGGQTYIFNDASLDGTYDPQPSDIVLFSIQFTTENASSRNPYQIDSVAPVDLSTVNQEDLESLNKSYAAHCEKEERKRLRNNQTVQSDYSIHRSWQLVQEKYGVTPLRDRSERIEMEMIDLKVWLEHYEAYRRQEEERKLAAEPKRECGICSASATYFCGKCMKRV